MKEYKFDNVIGKIATICLNVFSHSSTRTYKARYCMKDKPDITQSSYTTIGIRSSGTKT